MSHGNGHQSHPGASYSGGGHSGGGHSGGGHSGGGHSGGGHSGGGHSDGGDSGTQHDPHAGSSTLAPSSTGPSGGSDGSYAVHLDSLTDFARELDTQIDGIAKPSDGLASLVAQPMLMGQFGEASSLVSGHQTSVAAMHELLGQVRQAMVFAKDVTTTVAAGYQDADSHVAGGLHTDGRDDVTVSTDQLVADAAAVAHPAANPAVGAAAAVAGVGAAVAGAVTAGVSSITSTVATDVGNALDGVGQTVTQAAGQTVTDVGSTVTDALGGATQDATGSGPVPGLGGL